MIPIIGLRERVESILKKSPLTGADEDARRPKILVAAMDPEIRTGFAELLQEFSFDVIWLKSVEAAKNLLSKEKIAACFCGFWLQDGTYRQLVRHIRHIRLDTRVIILSGPACPEESYDLLTAMNLGAVDFLSYPYRRADMKRLFRFAMRAGEGSRVQPSSVIDSDSLAAESA